MISNVALHKSKNGVLAPFWDSALIEMTASGSVASFADGADGMPMVSVVADIEPIQDLHGYSNPWVGGSGKNLLPLTLDNFKAYNTDGSWSGNSYTWLGITYTVNTDTDGNVESIRVNGTASQNSLFQFVANNRTGLDFLPTGEYIVTGCPSGGSGTTYMLQMRVGNSWLEEVGSGKAFNYTNGVATVAQPCRIRIISGYTANNLVYKPMIRLSSVSDATFEPYSNICPISGWDSVNVTRCGKNLANVPNATASQANVSFTAVNGVVTANGTPNASSNIAIGTAHLKGGVEYTISGCPSGGGSGKYGVSIRDDSTTLATDYGSGATYTPTADTDVSVCIRYWYNYALSNVEFKPMIRLASETDATYEPYTAQTYPTTLPQTVYGGSLDVVSGVLTVTHGFVTLDGSETWSANISRNGFYTRLTDMLVGTRLAGLSNRLPTAEALSEFGLVFGVSNNTLYASEITTTISGVTDVASWKAWLASNPLQVVYPLAEPQTIQLTPTEVDSLLADNVLFADSGNIAVTYRADSTLAYNQLTNAIVSLGGNI